jgi:DNA-directed RNA polymerase specialized sigma24 family protein
MTCRSASAEFTGRLEAGILALFAPSPDYLDRLDRRGLRRLKNALAGLTRMQLRILLLIVLQRCSAEEVAAALGLSEVSITRAFAEARGQLRARATCLAYKE